MRPARSLALLVACAALGCGGASPLTGITANLRATNAQFVSGSLAPQALSGGPTVQAINIANTTVRPGLTGLPLSGTVQGGATVLVGLEGDVGYWIVPAPTGDPQTPGGYGFSTQLSFSPELPRAPQTLIMQGVAPDGSLGPSLSLPLTVAAAPLPTGALVISLYWDTNADLDLHVQMPNPLQDPTMPIKPIEIWAKSPLGLPPNPAGYDPSDPALINAGFLDFDSNAACVIDGRRQENVIFPVWPPSGDYVVRVDAFSMCGQAAAQWTVEVNTPDAAYWNPATWEATDVDTRGAHGVGAGRLAVQFSL